MFSYPVHRTIVTPSSHLTYSENGGNQGLFLNDSFEYFSIKLYIITNHILGGGGYLLKLPRARAILIDNHKI